MPTGDSTAILCTAPAGPSERRLAMLVAAASLAMFLVMAPFAKLQLPQVWAFIPIYESALVVVDLMTALMLLGQYRIGRMKALLVLACGYFFTASIAVAHALTFPGLFTPTGLLGAGAQSTAWIYMFWHAGFPLFVVAYALKSRPVDAVAGLQLSSPRSVFAGLVLVLAATASLTALATAGAGALPDIMVGNHYSPSIKAVVTTVWLLTVLAGVVLWRRRPHSIIDLWLLVVMVAWAFDIALSAVLNAGRFDLGFYGGRIYGLLAASFVLAMLIAENGTLYAKLVSAHDRTRQKAEDARQLSVQLESANVVLAEQNRQLEDASRLKSEFLSNMSHELRTPLNAVIGFSEVMKDGLAGELTPQQSGYIGHIFQGGQHLLALINDILDLSKIEAGKVDMELSVVDVDALLAESMAVLSEKAASAHVGLKLASHEALGGTLVDRRRLKQIVFNLVSNAIKFTPAHGQVSLHSRLVDRAQAVNALPGFGTGVRMALPENEHQVFVEISVADTGIGVGADDARKLFTPFTQIANQVTRRIEGTGLGLAMVKRLAELHGGAVAMSSEVGRGSCFTVWLPWRPVDAAQPGTVAAGAAAADAETQSHRPSATAPLALVVEDDNEAAVLMGLQLEAEGFRVKTVDSAEAALALTDTITPDLITVDIMLPGMDGWDLIARLRDIPTWAAVPVVVVSVVADRHRGFSLGASLVLQKPVGRDALSRGLVRLGLQPGSEATVLVIDDDPQAVEIFATHLRQSGYVVLRALGGREGIELARRFSPDLIALDLEMPGVNGFDVVEALTSHPATSQIPVVVVTAAQLTPAMRQRLNGHIHDVLDKTESDSGRFIGEVRRALARRPEATAR